jgi:transposase-like protein
MKIKCQNCNKVSAVKKGFRKNRTGDKQKYQCLICKSWFVEDDGFKRMRNKPEIIARAIHMHNDGLSLFNVKNHLWQYDEVKISREAVRYWVKKYSAFLKSHKFAKTKVKRKTTL